MGKLEEKIINELTWEYANSVSYFRSEYCNGNPNILAKEFIKKLRQELLSYRREIEKEALLDQLYRFEGVLGKYNCQHGGTKCNFQTNCHRLIRAEIDELKNKTNQ